ncbi:MAG: hypothetical protein GEU99_05480 [Luteitalea sp.]|nr:hypothetical protein [Luteitalea sp.]
MELIDYDAEGSRRVSKGEWYFAWVLEGRAIQDVLIAPPRTNRRPGQPVQGNRYGTTLRVYDPESGVWRVTWINAVTGAHNTLVGRKQDDEIVQEGRAEQGAPIRWIFSRITPQSFHWRGEVSLDEGKSWQLQAEFFGRRIRSESAGHLFQERPKLSDVSQRAAPRQRGYAVIEAPSNLGLRPPRPGAQPGVRHLPEVLEAAGFSKRVGAVHTGRVEPPPYSGAIDPHTGIREAPAIRDYSIRLAGTVGEIIDHGKFPIVLGGDCSILLGNLLALRSRGRHGLFFLDGHPDFATPETSESKAAAGMDLALATGHGPALLSSLDPRGALVREDDVVLLGTRGLDTEWQQRLSRTRMTLYTLDALRRAGIADRIRHELTKLQAKNVDGFWIHVDVDVLDDAVMPAVDSRQPDGLRFEELTLALRLLIRSPLAVGMHIGIYDPDLDPQGTAGRALTDALVSSLTDGRGRGVEG